MKSPFAVIIALLVSSCATTPDLGNAVAIDTAAIKANPDAISGYQYISTGQPDKELLALARDSGVVAVIDLRGVDENRGIDEAAAARSAGLRYAAVPVADTDDVTYENAAALKRLLSDIDGPVLLHCASGNRVGALFALQARADGHTVEEAMSIGEKAGLTRYRSVVRDRLEAFLPEDR